MKKFAIILFVLVAQASCTFYGITNDYNKLNATQQSKIKKCEEFSNLNPEYIYEVSGSHLRNELKKYQKSIVYKFANGCSSENCKALRVYEEYAEKNGYKLFLVMAGYDFLHLTTGQNTDNQLFAIDHDFYGTKWNRRASRYFTNELSGYPKDQKRGEYLGNLYFFENGELKSIYRQLPQ